MYASRLVVKTSTDAQTPPGVMNGRSGMAHQIDSLAHTLSLINQLLTWLLPRCKGTEHEASFNAAIGLLLESGNKAIALFGVPIRDTEPNAFDLQARGRALAGSLQNPTTCQLIAISLPCAEELGRGQERCRGMFRRRAEAIKGNPEYFQVLWTASQDYREYVWALSIVKTEFSFGRHYLSPRCGPELCERPTVVQLLR